MTEQADKKPFKLINNGIFSYSTSSFLCFHILHSTFYPFPLCIPFSITPLIFSRWLLDRTFSRSQNFRERHGIYKWKLSGIRSRVSGFGVCWFYWIYNWSRRGSIKRKAFGEYINTDLWVVCHFFFKFWLLLLHHKKRIHCFHWCIGFILKPMYFSGFSYDFELNLGPNFV